MPVTIHKTIVCRECKVPFTPQISFAGLIVSKFCPDCRTVLEISKRKAINHIRTLSVPTDPKKGLKIKIEATLKPKKKSKKVKSVKSSLDRVFSNFIRQRDSINGVVFCISCGKVVPWKRSDCGHYINRKHMATRYDEYNCNAQCRECNRFDESCASGYRQGLIKKYGLKAVETLELKKFNTSCISEVEMQLLLEVYKAKNLQFKK